NAHELENLATTLLIAATMLAALTISTVAVLVAWRMAAQTHQVGTLKAVGVTPWQVTGALLVEYLTVAGLAAAIGLASGTVLSPLLARSVRTLYGAPQAPPITWSRAGAVVAVAIAVVLLATIRPALRATRHSTLRSLTAGVRPPRRSSRLAQLGDRLRFPLAATLGMRAVLRRPGRTFAATLSTALGVAMVVAGLALDRRAREFEVLVSSTTDLSDVAKAELFYELRTVVLVAAALLLALACVNAIVAAVFAARDSARNHAVVRTVGGTPRQVVTAFVTAQLGTCLLGCAIGIPLGAGLFAAAGGGLPNLSAATYLAVAVAAPLVHTLIVSIPARLHARAPIAPVLSYE
ncbi:MAG TPA: FtsX-like permease family protein, partial [Candidatus Limnocylindrales bacterium]